MLSIGCEGWEDFDTENPLISISPESGSLVLGSTEAVDISATIFWPFSLAEGAYEHEDLYQFMQWPSPLEPKQFVVTGEQPPLVRLPSDDPVDVRAIRITFNPESTTPPPSGIHQLVILGEPFQLAILDPGTFELQIAPNDQRQPRNTTQTSTLTLFRAADFTSSVGFALNNPPQGISATFDPPATTGDTSLMHLAVDNTAALGVQQLSVTATGGDQNRTVSFFLDVEADVRVVELESDALLVAPGANGQTMVHVAGSQLPVQLSAANQPNVVSFAFAPNPTSDTSTLTVSVSPLAPLGTRQIVISGQFQDGLTLTDTLSLNIASSTLWTTRFTQDGVFLFGLGFEHSASGFGMAVAQSAATSSDGGRSWGFVTAPPSQLSDIAVVAPQQAIGVGGNKILRTNDGGLSWFERPSGLAAASWLAIAQDPVDPNLLVAVGRNGVITRSTNGGDDWVEISAEAAVPAHFYDVSLYGSTGTIVGVGTIGGAKVYRSTDFGVTWNAQTIPATGVLNAVSFVNENVGIAVGVAAGGADAAILKTSNGGAQWDALTSPVPAVLEDVAMLNSQAATAVGSGGVILQTFNGGQSWVQQSVPPVARTATIWKVFVFPDNSAVCVGNAVGCVILRREPLLIPFGSAWNGER